MKGLIENVTHGVTAFFLDVGQGDCTLVVDSATNSALLIDCPSSGVSTLLSYLKDNSIVLQTLIVTHWDYDHYGGVARVMDAVPTASVYYNVQFWNTNGNNPRIRTTMKTFLDRDDAQSALRSAEVGAGGSVGDSVRWSLLAPTHAELTDASIKGNRNSGSVVVDIQAEGLRILIGGDAEESIWQRLLTEPLLSLSADILRWPHHGALLGTDGILGAKLIEAVSPKHVVISVGTNNVYGHPNQKTIQDAITTSRVLCTQVNRVCLATPHARNDAVVEGAVPLTPCAGTIVAQSLEGHLHVTPTTETHQQTIDSWPAPICQHGALGQPT
ncbi:ComEC/Rec2 family competence protein [Mycobacteroides abscessus]|uniref:ComEC/Rec2 family competence protein n=1 Tax=Mycobacteroides abscessus TaxID=36809 RepID=UPI0014025A88|nr:MBL fold metallo-hydrolase [Mycobacteroides abscessus]